MMVGDLRVVDGGAKAREAQRNDASIVRKMVNFIIVCGIGMGLCVIALEAWLWLWL